MAEGNEVREFSTGVIVTLATGIMLCEDFSKVHEAAEFLMGHPIWTHHFANRELQQEMAATIFEQCPGVPRELNDVSADNWRAVLDKIIDEIGPIQRIRKGSGLTAMLPTDGIPDGMPVIAVKAP